MPRLLLVCTAFPPVVGGGTVRNLQIARGLAARGWEVTVLTGRRRSPVWDDPSPLADLPRDVSIVRSVSPDPARLIGHRRPASRSSDTVRGRRRWRPPDGVRRFALTWLLIPDADGPWIPFATFDAIRLIRRRPIDALLTAGPPHSAHLVGRAVRMATDARWIVDSQDPWADNPFPISRSKLRHRIDRTLQSWVFASADLVASATESQTARFQAVYAQGKDRFITLPSGHDDADFAGARPRRGQGRRIVHLGSLYGTRSPGAFIEALRRVAAAMPASLTGVEVLLAGYADLANERLIAAAVVDPVIGGILQYVPQVDRRRSLELMLGADLLLLITDPGAGGRELVPLKAFEYLRAGRPILALVPEGETAALLRRCGGSVIAHPAEPDAIATALCGWLAGNWAGSPDPEAVAELSFSKTIARLDALLRQKASRSRT